MYEVNFVCRVHSLEDRGSIMKLSKHILWWGGNMQYSESDRGFSITQINNQLLGKPSIRHHQRGSLLWWWKNSTSLSEWTKPQKKAQGKVHTHTLHWSKDYSNLASFVMLSTHNSLCNSYISSYTGSTCNTLWWCKLYFTALCWCKITWCKYYHTSLQ